MNVGAMRKPGLRKVLSAEIDRILEISGQKSSSGDLAGSVALTLQAWDMIPEPKDKWDYYPQSLSTGFVEDYADLKDKVNTQKRIEIAARMYGDANHEDQQILMLEGQAMYKLGDLDRAYYVFGRIDEIYGSKGFAGEEKQFLDWYRKQQSERQ